MSEPDHVEIIA